MMVRQAHQPSWVGYVIKNLAVVAFVVGFVACGGDSGTSSTGSPTEPEKVSESSSSLSEAEESSSSKDDDSSSSVIPSGGSAGVEGSSGSSSSSANVTPNSSSVVLGSSSSVTPSSSSVIPSEVEGSSSSSVASSSSSASVVPSSSSAEESSSSVYVPFDHKAFLAADLTVGKDRYKQFTDERNGRSYYYITITGRDTGFVHRSITVMAENLNIGEMMYGWDDQVDDTKIERYCYDEDTTNCDKYGGLYQWAEMMQLPSRCNTESCAKLIKKNHQGICPDGWRLLTYNDMYTIVHADGNDDGVKGVRSTYRFGGFNTTGYSLVGAGYNFDYKFEYIDKGTYWFYPEELDSLKVKVSLQIKSSTVLDSDNVLKTHGFSVRCVKLDE